MADTIYKGKIRQKTASGSVVLYPQTSADIVDYSNTIGTTTITSVKGALDKIISDGTGVTGIKTWGNTTSASTETGVVELTPAKIGVSLSGQTLTINNKGTKSTINIVDIDSAQVINGIKTFTNNVIVGITSSGSEKYVALKYNTDSTKGPSVEFMQPGSHGASIYLVPQQSDQAYLNIQADDLRFNGSSIFDIIKTIKYEIVTTLPTADADHEFNKSKTVYMKSEGAGKEQDYYGEYICIDKGAAASPRYAWEKIGDTRIDLSNYVKKSGDTMDGNLQFTGIAQSATKGIEFKNSSDNLIGGLYGASSSGTGDILYLKKGDSSYYLPTLPTGTTNATLMAVASGVKLPTGVYSAVKVENGVVTDGGQVLNVITNGATPGVVTGGWYFERNA